MATPRSLPADATSPPPRTLEAEVESRLVEGARFTVEFHMGESNVHRALDKLVERLSALDIPYAIVGALALNAYGYLRATVDVAVLLTEAGLARFKEACLGRGFVEKVPGGRGLRDPENRVDIDVVIAGEYPGDGREKPVSFPDPSEGALAGERFALLPLDKLIELKLASGMTAPHRLRDLADVIELVRVNRLERDLADRLDPFVRGKYLELWAAAQGGDAG
ncbi:MAG TPA: hypothetical protein VMV46_23315 [Thermoanaerobaculia bacterium]|nr:hypothetical protein [Thermoanaerobaculia bacterium]